MPKLKSCHFSLGNSTDGPLGFCAQIIAKSKAEAVEILREKLNDTVEVPPADGANKSGEYLHVYFNVDAITEKDIDEIEPHQD